jgi:hypothetical protein
MEPAFSVVDMRYMVNYISCMFVPRTNLQQGDKVLVFDDLKYGSFDVYGRIENGMGRVCTDYPNGRFYSQENLSSLVLGLISEDSVAGLGICSGRLYRILSKHGTFEHTNGVPSVYRMGERDYKVFSNVRNSACPQVHPLTMHSQ